MFWALTDPPLIISIPVIVEYELKVEKPLSYPPMRVVDTLLLKLSFSGNVPASTSMMLSFPQALKPP